MIFPIKVLADLGFEILATQGTAEVLRRNGVAATVVRKHFEGPGPNGEPTTVQLILAGEIDLVDQHPARLVRSGGSARVDGYEIRTAAVHGQHPVHHHRAGARRRRAGHRGAGARRHRRALAAGLGPRGDGRRTALLFDHVLTRVDPETRPPRSASAAIRAGRPGRPARVRVRPAAPVRAMGLDFPSVLGPGRRLRQERRRASTRSPRSGSASSRSARSPGEPQPGNPRPRLFRLPADRAVVNRMGFNNDGAEVVAARLRGAPGRPAPRRRRRASTSARPRWCPRTTRRSRDYEKSTRLLAPYADYLVVNVSSPEHPGPARPAGRRRGCDPLLDAVRRQADAVTGGPARAAAGQDRPRPRRRRRARRRRPGPRAAASTGSSPPTPRSPATAWPRRRPQVDGAGAGGLSGRAAAGAGRSRCCGCCATGSART